MMQAYHVALFASRTDEENGGQYTPEEYNLALEVERAEQQSVKENAVARFRY